VPGSWLTSTSRDRSWCAFTTSTQTFTLSPLPTVLDQVYEVGSGLASLTLPDWTLLEICTDAVFNYEVLIQDDTVAESTDLSATFDSSTKVFNYQTADTLLLNKVYTVTFFAELDSTSECQTTTFTITLRGSCNVSGIVTLAWTAGASPQSDIYAIQSPTPVPMDYGYSLVLDLAYLHCTPQYEL